VVGLGRDFAEPSKASRDNAFDYANISGAAMNAGLLKARQTKSSLRSTLATLWL